MKAFKRICRKNQKELKTWLEKLLRLKYKEVINGDGFLYAKGNGKCPILLTAHMDTVHKETCREIVVTKTKEKTTKIWSPQGIGGDDRCGIWMIFMILTKTKYRPSVLFCEDEEIGGVGSDKFVKTKYIKDLKELKYLVELDRANDNDAVYYDCGNEEFMQYIKETIGYKEAYGSFSDISHLSPKCDKASVNLSCGYYKAHTLEEYVIYEEMFRTFKATKKLCALAKESESYDYEEDKYDWFNTYGNKYTWYDTPVSSYGEQYEVVFNNKGTEDIYCTIADSEAEAMYQFFVDNPNTCFNDIIDCYSYVA